VCVFEDEGVSRLAPLSLTRPACDLRCGASTLLERQRRHFGAADVSLLVRPRTADWCRFLHPDLPVNDPGAVRTRLLLLVNARWLPPAEVPDGALGAPQVALAGSQVAYAVLPAPACLDGSPLRRTEGMQSWVEALPHTQAGGRMIDYPWDLLAHNAEALEHDLVHRHRGRKDRDRSPRLIVVGPCERLFVAEDASVEPLAVADTTGGPVVIDSGAVVQAFSRLEGPCHVGAGSRVLGARVRASSIGPHCRVGGEVEASILQGCSNKAHEGFLGHSYVGEWVNLGAGTQVSNLRNDHGNVRVPVAGKEVDTGLVKVGAFLGDYTRTGLGTLLDCGTLAGPFAQLLPWGFYAPKVVPPFCTLWQGRLQERTNFRRMFETASRCLERRGRRWTEAHGEFFLDLYEETAAQRRDALDEEALARGDGKCGRARPPACHEFCRSRR
jgi:UDP-N-acetylglucosamine diphosphorylase/glucosamine-1-phosphate N-acetyltransferase